MNPEATAVDLHADVAGAEVGGLLAVGSDGATFALRPPHAFGAELWRLHPHALTDGVRRRMAALSHLPHEALLRLQRISLDGEAPYLVVGSGTLRWGALDALSSDLDELRSQLSALARALAAAHRLDVVCGRIGPSCLAACDGRLVLDLTALSIRPGEAETAPEQALGPPSAAADVWALGAMLAGTAASSDPSLRDLLDRMCDPDPERRPTAGEVAEELAPPGGEATMIRPGQSPAFEPPPQPPTEGAEPDDDATPLFGVPRHLGAYRLLEQIGAGGMGRVFRARDRVGGPDVAVKVLLPAWAKESGLVARFRREARVLAQLQSPHVVRFIGANEEAGFHYLVMELVRARGADDLLRERGRLELPEAISIVADTARALAELHSLGLVHRDVKPANLLVQASEQGGPPRVKLCDFGIVRPTEPDPAQLTQEGTPGTPSYMAPEQVEGAPLDARVDVYALGATLYCLLAGRPPFVGTPHFVMVAHVMEEPAPLQEHEPSVPAAVAGVVMRCLAKAPEDRFRDGAELLEALESAWHGPPAAAELLPQPIGLSGSPRVYDFRWSLQSEPHELWPHVSNTERLNRAAGLDDVEWTHARGDGYVQTEGSFRAAGMELRWKENPFEWVAPHRLGVVREYTAGPFRWLRNVVELEPREGGGTDLRHRIEILPRNLIGRAAATVEVGLKLRRGLERVYQRIDASCVAVRQRPGERPQAEPGDPFEAPKRAGLALREEIERRARRVIAAGADPLVVEALEAFLGSASEQKLGRIRPRVWAREHGLADEAVLTAFLRGAAEGLLEVMWDILCPSCRIPSDIEGTLRSLQSHGRCEVCDLDFELDMARSVELVFRAHPSLRPADLGVYCIGGPAHSPHVLAQVRLSPGERFTLRVELPEGRYCIAGRGLPARWSFAVDRRSPFDRWDLPLRAGAPAEVPRSLCPGAQHVVLTNDLDHEVLVRLERSTARDDAVTAADAASHSLFRELFPEQVLSPDRLVAISDVALLFAHLPDALLRFERDEASVHRELVELSRRVEEAAQLEGGGVVRLQGDGVLAVFSDRVAAVRSALRLGRRAPTVGVALHAGAARMTTIGGRLDYFGKILHVGEHMGRSAEEGELLVGEPILSDPILAELVHGARASRGCLRIGSMLVGRYR